MTFSSSIVVCQDRERVGKNRYALKTYALHFRQNFQNFRVVFIRIATHKLSVGLLWPYELRALFRLWSPEIHSKQRYKNCICSVILGTLSLFELLRASRILEAICRLTNVRICLIPISGTFNFFNPKILRFLFLRKTAFSGSEM